VIAVQERLRGCNAAIITEQAVLGRQKEPEIKQLAAKN
jgi:hypothetical protein